MKQNYSHNTIIYRRSKKDDAEAIYAVMLASISRLAPEPYSQKVVDTWMVGRTAEDYRVDSQKGLFWVAEKNEKIVGFSHGEQGEIKRLFVNSNAVGIGIGQKLMERALADALKGNVRVVEIDATLNAASFYEKWGFQRTGAGVFPGREDLPAIEIVKMRRINSETKS